MNKATVQFPKRVEEKPGVFIARGTHGLKERFQKIVARLQKEDRVTKDGEKISETSVILDLIENFCQTNER